MKQYVYLEELHLDNWGIVLSEQIRGDYSGNGLKALLIGLQLVTRNGLRLGWNVDKMISSHLLF